MRKAKVTKKATPLVRALSASALEKLNPPLDIDTALQALTQAHAILDLMTVAASRDHIPDTYPSTFVQCLFAAMGEIDRAYVALMGAPIHKPPGT